MKSLREQLARLFPKLGRDEVASKAPRPKPSTARPSAPVPAADIDWKKGVTPLSASTSKVVHTAERATLTLKGLVPAGANKQSRKLLQLARVGKPTRPIQPQVPIVAKPQQAIQAKQKFPEKQTPSPLRFGGFRPPALTRVAEFKAPDAWIAAGAELQPPGGGKGRVLPVRIGIDFGTAYSKVAIRVGDLGLFFLSWEGVRNSAAPYLLPGEFSIAQDGSVWIGRMSGAEEIRSDLKLPFVTRDIRSREQFAAAIAFLAWIMRYARAWLYANQAALLVGRKLAWQVNLGCPSSSWGDVMLKFPYQSLGLFAWKASQSRDRVFWNETIDMANSARPDAAEIGLDGLYLMPEFVAQIAGYVRSPQRRDGLHLLMDVGAGTVDLAIFMVMKEYKAEKDRYPIFASEVLPLGTHFLMAERHRQLGIQDLGWDDFVSVPTAEEFAKQAHIEPGRAIEADSALENRLAEAIVKLLRYTQTRRHGNASEWTKGLPTFLSGGGAGCDVYVRSLELAFAECGLKLRRTHFPLLEEASKLQGIGRSTFHRLSVAYGLTFDAESIGRILAPHEVPDAPRVDTKIHAPRRRLDHEDMYTKP